MNMSNNYQEQEFDYNVDSERRGTAEKAPRRRKLNYGKANRPAVMHNGIHRRRNKRTSW